MARDISNPDRAALARAQWEAEFPELSLLPMELLGRLAEVGQIIRKDHLEPLMAEHGLKPGEFDVLATLRRSGAPHAMTPTELFNSTMISSGGMTARLDKLEKAGMIRRAPHDSDRRALTVVLTAEGKDLIEEILPKHIAVQDRILSALSTEERQHLADLLRAMLTGLMTKGPSL